MAVRNALPFEFPFRWQDVREWFGLEIGAVATMEERDRALEDYLANSRDPLIFHWPGLTSEQVNVRNGAGKFFRAGAAWRVEYVFDTAPASGVTVEWEFDGAVVWTHSLGTTDEQQETEADSYVDEHMVATVTAADATASGMTAFVFLE